LLLAIGFMGLICIYIARGWAKLRVSSRARQAELSTRGGIVIFDHHFVNNPCATSQSEPGKLEGPLARSLACVPANGMWAKRITNGARDSATRLGVGRFPI